MVDLFRQSTELRTKSIEFRAAAEVAPDRELRDRLSQLAGRYLDIANSLQSLAIATALVEDMRTRDQGSRIITAVAAE